VYNPGSKQHKKWLASSGKFRLFSTEEMQRREAGRREERIKASDRARRHPLLSLEGLPAGNLEHTNGLFVLQPNLSKGRRPVYKHQHQDMYLFFAASMSKWYIGKETSMRAGKASGWLMVNSQAMTADQIQAQWKVYDPALSKSWTSSPAVQISDVKWSLPRLPRFFFAPNIAEIDVHETLVSHVRDFYEAHVLPAIHDESTEIKSKSTQAGEIPLSFYRQFAGGKFRSDIKWVFPADYFAYTSLVSFLGEMNTTKFLREFVDLDPDQGELQVYIPSFVVRVQVNKRYYHMDWPKEGGSNGLTLMLPLYDMEDQENGCHLLYKDLEGNERVYKYQLGKAVIFGGGLIHSSQPCEARSIAEHNRPWAFLCYNFGTNKMKHWKTIGPQMECSGKFVVLPNGTVQNTSSCSNAHKELEKG